MPTLDEAHSLYRSLRAALKEGRKELRAATRTMDQMANTLDDLDSLNGDILAAASEAELAAALAAARGKLKEVQGFSYNVTVQVLVDGQPVPVLDDNGEPVLVDGHPVYQTRQEQRVEPGFLDKAAAICQRIGALDTPELRAGIAAGAAGAGA